MNARWRLPASARRVVYAVGTVGSAFILFLSDPEPPSNGAPLWIFVAIAIVTLWLSILLGAMLLRDAADLAWYGSYLFALLSMLAFVGSFSVAHWLLSGQSTESHWHYSRHLDKSDSVYFTVTIFSTTGFGDIHPTSDAGQWLVATQMFFGFVLVVGMLSVIVSRAIPLRDRTRANKG